MKHTILFRILMAAALLIVAVPVITSFKVMPSPVRAQGGTVTMTAKARSAKTCTFSIKPKVTGFPVTRHCASGTARASDYVGAKLRSLPS